MGSSAPGPTRGLLLLVVAFLVSRGVWIVAAPESGFYWEEMYRWVVAHELIEGVREGASLDAESVAALFLSPLVDTEVLLELARARRAGAQARNRHRSRRPC